MSGLEIAGLVLGVLPIAGKTLQTYKAILSSYNNAVRLIHTLEADLINEHFILTCTCETLLQGIAPSSKIDLMLKDPFGPEWKQEQFSRDLRIRLGGSYASVEKAMEELKRSVEELMTKLGVGQDLKTKLSTREAILQEIKKKTTFTLKKNDYDAVLAKIKSANSRLYVLVGLNKGLEPRRRHRSQWRFTQLLRDLSRSLFNALDGATVACCSGSHDACLTLTSRALEMEPGSVEDQVAKDLDFEVSLGLYSRSMSSGCLHVTQTPLRWYTLSVAIVNFGHRHVNDYLPKTLDLRPSPHSAVRHQTQARAESATKSVSEEPDKRKSQSGFGHIIRRITRKGRAINALIQGSLDLIVKPSPKVVSCSRAPSPGPVLGLCQIIRRQEKRPATDNERLLYGLVMDREDPDRRFGLYAPIPQKLGNQHGPHASPYLFPQQSDLPTILTLRQILEQSVDAQFSQTTGLVFLEFQQKLQLAVIVAVNILHLYSSPWLPRIITLDDILFRLEDEESSSSRSPLSSDFQPQFPYRPFIKKSMPFSASSAILETDTLPRSRKREITVFSFGLVLIQIMLGRAIGELDMKPASKGQSDVTSAAEQSANNTITTTMSMNDYMTKFQVGSELNNNAVLQEAGEEYNSAVTWCLKSFINIGGLQDERFCQEFYVNVISMLQEALDKAMGI